MKITLSIDSKHSMEVTCSELVDFLGFFNDNSSSADFYNVLASHPASRVRAAVAEKTCLPVATLEKLAVDPSIEVVQKVACNETALMAFGAELFKTMIERDVIVALELASNGLDSIKPSVRKAVTEMLMRYEDPDVLDALQFGE